MEDGTKQTARTKTCKLKSCSLSFPKVLFHPDSTGYLQVTLEISIKIRQKLMRYSSPSLLEMKPAERRIPECTTCFSLSLSVGHENCLTPRDVNKKRNGKWKKINERKAKNSSSFSNRNTFQMITRNGENNNSTTSENGLIFPTVRPQCSTVTKHPVHEAELESIQRNTTTVGHGIRWKLID